jgi:hypothetical protein
MNTKMERPFSYGGGQRAAGGLGDKVMAGINPINYTIVYILSTVGISFALIITIIAYAVIPAKKTGPNTKKIKSNMVVRIAITFVVLSVSLLICGGLGYHQGMKMGFCWTNPKACAATTGMSMAFDVFD